MTGSWLRRPQAQRGEAARLKRLLGLEQRTLTRWRGKAGPMKRGRPGHSQQTLDQARPKVQEVLATFGNQAGRATAKILLPQTPMRVISSLLHELKRICRREEAARLKKNRVHVKVLAVGALLAQDSTHVGSSKGRRVWAEVTKDAASCWAKSFGGGKPITGAAMIGHLEELKAAKALPLVLATDNGSAYKEASVQAWLRKHKVIQLFSRPRTPTDNGRAERGIGEGKRLAGLGKGRVLETAPQGPLALDQALQTLNQGWPRSSKGGLTAAQLKQSLPKWTSFTTRLRFYETATKAIGAVFGDTKPSVRRKTREAIFRTLEGFGLILRTQGEQNLSYAIEDRIS